MKYTSLINQFKSEITTLWKNTETSKPKRDSKELQIRVTEKKPGIADVELYYNEEFYRMFGKTNTVWVHVLTNVKLKDACDAARELKMESGLAIKFYKYEPELDNDNIWC